MGGGYDSCEDANQPSPTCSGAKGNRVYVLDAKGVIRHKNVQGKTLDEAIAAPLEEMNGTDSHE